MVGTSICICGENVMGKKISVLIPCFNEVENVRLLSEAIVHEFDTQLSAYDYEIIFIDNYSTDGTKGELERVCAQNYKIKAIFNNRNYGQFNSPYYGILQTQGDCTIMMCADFQDPVELIPQMVKEWESGYKIVTPIKVESEENPVMYFLRSCYYKTIKKMSSVEQIEHFTGFGLYDKSFVDLLRTLDDPIPFLRGVVAELGSLRKELPYKQAKRRAGHTHNNWYTLYDGAMLSFTSYTKIGLRVATLIGFLFSLFTMLVALFYLGFKLMYWDQFQAGVAPVVIGMFFLGSIQLFFLGLLGEYVLSINARVMKRPLVVEEKRINF